MEFKGTTRCKPQDVKRRNQLPQLNWRPPPEPGTSLVCTEKDAAKLWRLAPDAWAVPLLFTPEPAFFAALDAKLSSIDGHQAA